jgi:hypothetical protein
VTWAFTIDFLLFQQPMTALLLISALVTFIVWKRTRFFGTASALIVFVWLMLAGAGSSVHGALPLYLMALPFAFVFIAGVASDLIELPFGKISLVVIVGILIGHAVIDIVGLLGL